MSTKIKVDRLMLLKALQDEQKKITAKFTRDMAAYVATSKAYPAKLADALVKITAQVRKGRVPKEMMGRYLDGQTFGVTLPPTPKKPTRDNRLCELERMITTLKLSKEEGIVLDEQSPYIRFVCNLT